MHITSRCSTYVKHEKAKDSELKLPTELLVDWRVAEKEKLFCENVPDECYWFGFIRPIEMALRGMTGGQSRTGWFPFLYDIAIPEQEVSGGGVDLEGTVTKLMEELIAEGKEEQIAHMKYFAHSHANFSVYHSNIDITQIDEWDQLHKQNWFFSHVRNRKGETTTRLDVFRPFRMFVPEVHTHILMPEHQGHLEWAQEQITAKVKEKQSHFTGSSGYTGSLYSPGHNRSTRKSVPPIVVGSWYKHAWEHYIETRLMEVEDNAGKPIFDDQGKPEMVLQRVRIMNGYVVDVQDVETGIVDHLKHPSKTEQETMRKSRKIKEGVKVVGRAARATDKPNKEYVVEKGTGEKALAEWNKAEAAEAGKGQGSQGTQSRLPAPAGVNGQSSRQSSSSSPASSQQAPPTDQSLPQGVEADDVLSEDDAAQRLYNDENEDAGQIGNMSRIAELMTKSDDELTDEEKTELQNWEDMVLPIS